METTKKYVVGDTTRKILKCYQSQNIFFNNMVDMINAYIPESDTSSINIAIDDIINKDVENTKILNEYLLNNIIENLEENGDKTTIEI
jgi:hypothetical protein